MSYIAFPATATTGSVAYTASDAVVGAPVGDGTLITGASTAGSIVSIAIPDGMQSWILLLKGYVSGAIYTEASNNSTNGTDGDWVEVKGRRTGTAPGTESVVYAMVANGYYRGNCSGFRYLRGRLIGATGPTARFEVSTALGPTFLNSGIPSGSSLIGSVGIDQTTPGTTNLVAAGGNVASGATDAGNPVKIGGKSNSAVPTAVATGQRTDAWLDTYGRQVIVDTDAETGTSQGITTYRERVIAPRYSVLADSIADGLATFWTQTTSTGGTITVNAGEGLLQTSAAANGSAQLVSTIPAYYPGQSHWSIAAARFGDTGVANNIRRIGAFTVSGGVPQDGFAFELNGTTFNAVTYKAGVATAVPSASWTRAAISPFTPDANYHLWEERWTGNRVDFYIDNVLRHTVSGTTLPITTTLNFPMAAQNINSTNATNVVLAARNIGLGRFGTPETLSSAGPLSVAKAQNSASVLADVGIPNLAVRKAVPANIATVDGNYDMLQMYNGRLWTTATIDNNSLISTANSSTVNLAANATFIGAAEDLSEYNAIMVSIFSSHASATDGLKVQQSADGINWDFVDIYTISAATGKTFNMAVNARYFRINYTNGATLTTSFRLQIIFSKTARRSSSVRAQDARSNDIDVDEASSFLLGFNGTSWDRLRSTIANGLQVDVTRLAPLPNSTVVNRGGTIAAGGTAQTLAAANSVRTGLTIQNTHASLDLWLTEDGVTTAALGVGYKIPAGASAKINTQKLISIWGSTTGQTFAATEF